MAAKFYIRQGFWQKANRVIPGGLDMERVIKWVGDVLHIPYYTSDTTDNYPVSFDTTDGVSYYDGTDWVAATSGTTTAITANAGGGQSSGTALTAEVNEVTTAATTGDSVKLPTAKKGKKVTVKNSTTNSIDIFPATGGTINGQSANTAIKLGPKATVIIIATSTTAWQSSTQVLAAGDGTVGAPSLTFNTTPNMGLYKVSSTQLGMSVGGTLVNTVGTNGIYPIGINEAVTNVGIQAAQPIVQSRVAVAKNSTGSATAAELSGGLITSTSAAAVALTLPTATALATQIGAIRGTTFEFVVDNISGANTVTVTVASGITAVTAVVTGSDTLTVASGVAGMFRLYFTSTSAAKLSRIF